MDENKRVIRIRIRDLRRERAVTQEELAEALGISRQSINAMEAGRSLPSLPIALQIASYFAVPLTQLLNFGTANEEITTLPALQKEQAMPNYLTPWTPLREMREMLDDMMEESMHLAPLTALTVPAANISQTAEAVHVELRLPGFKKEDLAIEVGEDFLTVSGETKHEEKSEQQYFRREFAAQNFTRTLALPAPVQPDKAEAEMKHGVLHITLQKVAEEKPKTSRVEIKAE